MVMVLCLLIPSCVIHIFSLSLAEIFITFNQGCVARKEQIVIPFVKTLWQPNCVLVLMSSFIPSLSRQFQEYPAFFNQTTINWFDMLPLKALKIERTLSCVMVLLGKQTD